MNLAVIEVIRYHDFLTSSEAELKISAPTLSLSSISETADAAEYAKLIRTYFGVELDVQFHLQSTRQFICIFVSRLKARASSFIALLATRFSSQLR